MSEKKLVIPPIEQKPQARAWRGNPAKFISGVLSAYEPDKEFAEKQVPAMVRSFNERMIAKGKGSLPDLVEFARVIEVNAFGALRIRTLESSDAYRAALAEADKKRATLRKITESGVRFRPLSSFSDAERGEAKKIGESKKFREDFGFDGTPSGSTSDPFAEYIPLMGGPFSHQQYLHDFLDGLAKSFEAWNHNPLAHQIVKLTTHFVLGRGISFKANDPLVQDAFRKWWDENEMAGRLEFWSDTLSLNGELMIRKFTNKITGELFVRWLDPSTIWEIVTDIEDIERVFYYHQQYPTAYQVLYGAPRGSKFNPSNFESSKYVINQIPADEVIHVKVNCVPNEKRGRSDLFSILGWLKRYKDFQTAVVLRAIAQASFVFKNKLSGTQTDVDAYIAAYGTTPPAFASMWVENEASTLELMTPTGGSAGAPEDCPGIINAVAVGSGIPKEYLGLSEHGTRATAVVASEPGVKKFQARQLLLGRVLKDIAQAWAANEIAMGRIPASQPGDDEDLPVVIAWVKRNASKIPLLGNMISKMIDALSATAMSEPTDTAIEFQFPEIASEDRTAKLADLKAVKDDGTITHRRYSIAAAKEMGFEDYDYQDEMDEIAEERSSDLSSIYNALGTPQIDPKTGQPIPPKPGQPPAPGAPPASGKPAAPPAPAAPDKGSGGLSGQDRRDIKGQNR